MYVQFFTPKSGELFAFLGHSIKLGRFRGASHKVCRWCKIVFPTLGNSEQLVWGTSDPIALLGEDNLSQVMKQQCEPQDFHRYFIPRSQPINSTLTRCLTQETKAQGGRGPPFSSHLASTRRPRAQRHVSLLFSSLFSPPLSGLRSTRGPIWRVC